MTSGPASWLANPSETRRVLEESGFATKHRLGQNFLVSDAVIAHILRLAELDDGDVVLEVGPGIGTLTVALLPRAAAVCAIEADRSLPAVLARTCARDGEKLALIQADALKVGPERIGEALADLGLDLPRALPNKFVSNLPYQVAATLILGFFQQQSALERAVVMVQREVADRISARPGSKTYGAYTAKLALYAEVTGRFEVSPQNFMPAPHVDSAVVRLDRRMAADEEGRALDEAALARTCSTIDAAFAQRRKTIRNSMGASGFEKSLLDAAFAAAGVAPTARAETLGVADFIRLAGVLDGLGAFAAGEDGGGTAGHGAGSGTPAGAAR